MLLPCFERITVLFENTRHCRRPAPSSVASSSRAGHERRRRRASSSRPAERPVRTSPPLVDASSSSSSSSRSAFGDDERVRPPIGPSRIPRIFSKVLFLAYGDAAPYAPRAARRSRLFAPSFPSRPSFTANALARLRARCPSPRTRKSRAGSPRTRLGTPPRRRAAPPEPRQQQAVRLALVRLEVGDVGRERREERRDRSLAHEHQRERRLPRGPVRARHAREQVPTEQQRDGCERETRSRAEAV